ncbi:MAG TPA: hypothetical protein VGH84_16820 [Steroidobacteraceae bacterium]
MTTRISVSPALAPPVFPVFSVLPEAQWVAEPPVAVRLGQRAVAGPRRPLPDRTRLAPPPCTRAQRSTDLWCA